MFLLFLFSLTASVKKGELYCLNFSGGNLFLRILDDNLNAQLGRNEGVRVEETPGKIKELYMPSEITLNGEKVTIIGIYDNGFLESKITKYIFNQKMSYLGRQCFTASAVEVIDLSQTSITSIPNSCFSYCFSLHTIYFPTDLNTLDEYAFQSCTSLESLSLEDYPITKFCKECFVDCANLKTIYLPNILAEIHDSAFKACTSLLFVDLPNTVSSVGSGAFCFCYSLLEIDMSKTQVEYFPYSLFYEDNSLDTVKLPPKLTHISKYVFTGCPIAYIEFNSELSVIEDLVFSDSNIRFVDLTNTAVQYITDECFINSRVEEAFVGCTVGSRAFKNCTFLKRIVLSSKVKQIKSEAFVGCSSLTTIEMSECSDLQIMDNCFANDTSLKEVDIIGVINLGVGVFSNCSSLSFVNCTKSSFTEIGENAFEACENLELIVFPDQFVNCPANSLPEIKITVIKYGGKDVSYNGNADITFYSNSANTMFGKVKASQEQESTEEEKLPERTRIWHDYDPAFSIDSFVEPKSFNKIYILLIFSILFVVGVIAGILIKYYCTKTIVVSDDLDAFSD